MKKSFVLLLLLSASGWLLAGSEFKVDPIPTPVSNNAVASLRLHRQLLLFSFMGMGPKKTWDSVSSASFMLDADSGSWSTLRSVPGTAGRIAAMAVGARDQVYVMGGYVLYAQGGGMAVPDVGIYQPHNDRWIRGADIPVPVGDSVIGAYRDRYIYLVGGRSNSDAVGNVQLYDAEKNEWSQATSIPGAPVFGHAGALVGDTIVYVDGARQNPPGSTPKYAASDECWMGKIDHHEPQKIQWTKLPSHPGAARFRIAAGGSEKDQMIYFSGGSDDPYLNNGIGYDGKPAEPSSVTFAFNLRTEKWGTLNDNTPDPTMDHRGLLVTSQSLAIIGGMEKGQQVTGRVAVLSKQPKAK